MKIEIDFFEYGFLLEACIPPRPIARTWFWQKSINEHYNLMTKEERSELFKWLTKNSVFKDSLDKGEEDVVTWYARYDPDNQYRLTVDYKGEVSTKETFLKNGRFYTNINTSIVEDYIKNIEKI
jgi:hypothetical protein